MGLKGDGREKRPTNHDPSSSENLRKAFLGMGLPVAVPFAVASAWWAHVDTDG